MWCQILVLLLPLFAAAQDELSLAFVFDSTESMLNELDQMKVGMQDVLRTILSKKNNRIKNFLYVQFYDTDVISHETRDEREFGIMINSTLLGDLGIQNVDCPESSLGGIKRALKLSKPNSYIYVITDAGAKDAALVTVVTDLVREKGCEVVFLLTGKCRKTRTSNVTVYYDIARISSGQVFNVQKGDVSKVLQYVKSRETAGQLTTIAYIEKPTAGSTDLEVFVDQNIDVFKVTASGGGIKMDILAPNGKLHPANSTINTGTVLGQEINNPTPGMWKVELSSNTAHSLKVDARSTLEFNVGFSETPADSMVQTYKEPVNGVENSLLIQVTESTNLIQLSKVRFISLTGDVLQEESLEMVPGNNKLFRTKKLRLPTQDFRIQLIGTDADGSRITGNIRFPIRGCKANMDTPKVTVDDSQLHVQAGDSATFKVHVIGNPTPNVVWTKDGKQITNGTKYQILNNGFLRIMNVEQSDAGEFQYTVTNAVSSTSINVTLHVDPKAQKDPQTLHVVQVECVSVPQIEVLQNGKMGAQIRISLAINFTIPDNYKSCTNG